MLEAFTHDPSPAMSFGVGRLARLPDDVAALVGAGARVLVVTDGGLVATGLPALVAEGLRAAGHTVEVFSEVQSDPTAASIDAAAARARAIAADVIVGLGGGSALDAAKLAACVAVAEAPAEAYAVMARPLPDNPIRKILVPTTSGTGAEMTRTSVYGIGAGRKVWAWGAALKADLAILDPVATRGLPAPLTAATGLDALVHAIEACTHRRATPVVEGLAQQAIRMLAGSLERAVAAPGDLEARGRMAVGSALAGAAIDACGTGIAHAFGHALGTLAHIHHGRAVALAMRVTMPWACAARPELYAPVALALGVDPGGTADTLGLALAGAARFEALLRAVALPVSLAGDGLAIGDAARLAAVAVAPENRPMVDSNAVQPTDADVMTLARAILAAA